MARNDVTAFGFGTIKDFLGKGGKGLLVGLGVAAVVAVAPAVLVGTAITGGIGVLAGIATAGLIGAFTAGPIIGLSGSIGAAYGGVTGGAKGVKENNRAQAEALDVQAANIDYRLQKAQEQNLNLRTALSNEQKAANYQMHNHLADGNAPDKFTSKFAGNKAAPEQVQAQGGMSK